MIEQRVTLTPQAHKRIAAAQHRMGLARFNEALGYFVLGACMTWGPDKLAAVMERGRKASRGRA